MDQPLSCEALLIGRTTYELFAKNFPIRTDLWGERINTMPKYVFSSTLEKAVRLKTPGSRRTSLDKNIYNYQYLKETISKWYFALQNVLAADTIAYFVACWQRHE